MMGQSCVSAIAKAWIPAGSIITRNQKAGPCPGSIPLQLCPYNSTGKGRGPEGPAVIPGSTWAGCGWQMRIGHPERPESSIIFYYMIA